MTTLALAQLGNASDRSRPRPLSNTRTFETPRQGDPQWAAAAVGVEQAAEEPAVALAPPRARLVQQRVVVVAINLATTIIATVAFALGHILGDLGLLLGGRGSQSASTPHLKKQASSPLMPASTPITQHTLAMTASCNRLSGPTPVPIPTGPPT